MAERGQPAVCVEEGVLQGIVREVDVVEQVEGEQPQALVVQVHDRVERPAVAALGGLQREGVYLGKGPHRTPTGAARLWPPDLPDAALDCRPERHPQLLAVACP